MEIAYRAHTETCTLLLDAGGICRSVQAISSMFNGRTPRIPSSAEKCIGAQYVASLDLSQIGLLAKLPEPGAQLLFARIEIDGRIALVRSAPLVRFEHVTGGASGVHERDDLDYGEDDARTEPHVWCGPLEVDVEIDEHDDDATIPRTFTYPPPRESMKVPAHRGFALPKVTIPPLPAPPRLPTPSRAPDSGPTLPRRPSLARTSSPMFGEAPTLPFRRTAR